MRTAWMIALVAAGLVFAQPRVQIRDVERIVPDAGDPAPGILDRLPQLALGPADKMTQLVVRAGKSKQFEAVLGEEIVRASRTPPKYCAICWSVLSR